MNKKQQIMDEPKGSDSLKRKKRLIIDDAYDNAFDTWKSQLYNHVPMMITFSELYYLDKQDRISKIFYFPDAEPENWDRITNQLIAEYYFYDVKPHVGCDICGVTHTDWHDRKHGWLK